ncbi:MAG: leucine-rich repeat domain-containing protein [Treponema sp.]|nr:leucine-rich repeat domain-containing protein [Treponema sp.]
MDESAFSHNKLTKITFPDSLTSIGYYAPSAIIN